jgi:alanine-glyoxylate transaminase/(R)-3-amino-2-methylpropionate-pyruvate transaminase
MKRFDETSPAPAHSYDYDSMLASRKRNYLPLALYHDKPLHLVKAKDMYVWDGDGRQYLDCIGGIVCISAGHNHPKIKAKLIEMLENDEIQHTSTLYLSQHLVDLTETMVSHAPKGLDRASFTNSGSEANELAFMSARVATGENIMINLRHSYHGGTAATQAQCGHHSWRFPSQPVTGAVSAMEPYCYRCPFMQKPDSCNLECAKNVESTIQTATHGAIAGMIVEPVMGVGGFITPPDAYFGEVTEIVHRYGGMYISDEVQTGAGRCGHSLLLSKELGIDCDMVTMAKGLGNGAAVGGVLMKSAIADSLQGKLYFNTFAGDPMQAAQAKATVDVITEEKLSENALNMGQRIVDGIEQMMTRHDLIGDVRGRGLLLGMELVKDRRTKEHAVEETARLMDLCKDRGVLLGKGGLNGNVIRIAPPLTINAEQVDHLLEVIDQGLAELGGRA